MEVGGLSTGVVEVEAGKLWVEGPLQSVVRDRRTDAGPVSPQWWSTSWCRERSL